jgi:uncharacterized protein (TIGR02246 family)
MKPKVFAAALVLSLAMATSALADDAEAIRRLDKEISVATWTADPVWFEENLADDYVLVTPTGAMKSKREVIRELATPGMRMEPFDPFEVQVRTYGDTAVVTGRMRQRFILGGIRYANDLRYTDVYVKRKTRWLLVSAHASTVAIKR